ncbi:MAG: Argininosuccinate synthase [Firmicutes bacterium ADurb.Bin248]|nr:MAG: Argininosuccinate synthase [Firmicutes bacterium ADurb.Bin248]HOG00398.1 argininosuccinate synthase [Clostridia bacterium]HPK15810.1 argininosuccinate synthase [Clostridia bacterium]
MAKEKIALAYSGGLDTSVMIPWLKENYDCEVIAVAVDVGQGEELAPLREKAIRTGASKIYIEDARQEYIRDFVFPTLKVGAKYENKYLLGTATARPVIAKRLVKVALGENCTAIAHGCTGKGNDQVRFELTIKAFAPEMRVIAPWRIWDIKGRKEEIEYAREKNVPLQFSAEETYSMDRNLWHLSHEGLDLEDPWNEPKDSLYLVDTAPGKTPDAADYIEIGFEKGVPVSVNGEALDPVALVSKCNALGAKHAIGIDDMVENRLVGIKCRGVYETPGGTILYDALEYLESITLDRDTMHFKHQLAQRYADTVYDGKWYTPLREALAAAVDVMQERTTGVARLKLFKGRTYHAGVKSPYSMYDPILATFEKEQTYNQKDAAGFISLFSLPIKVRALLDRNAAK